LHGGTIEAQSAGPGRGSTFTLRLPLGHSDISRAAFVEAGAEPPRHVGPSAGDRPEDLAGIEVPLVGAEPDSLAVVRAMIADAGAKVSTVTGADEALAELHRRLPSVIVSDLDMPGTAGDGFALIRAVRCLSPEEGGRIPAIALTAHAGAANRS